MPRSNLTVNIPKSERELFVGEELAVYWLAMPDNGLPAKKEYEEEVDDTKVQATLAVIDQLALTMSRSLLPESRRLPINGCLYGRLRPLNVELASIDFSAIGINGGSCMSLWREKSEGRTYRHHGKTRLSTELSGLSPQEDPNASF